MFTHPADLEVGMAMRDIIRQMRTVSPVSNVQNCAAAGFGQRDTYWQAVKALQPVHKKYLELPLWLDTNRGACFGGAPGRIQNTDRAADLGEFYQWLGIVQKNVGDIFVIVTPAPW